LQSWLSVTLRKKEKLASMCAIPEFLNLSDDDEEDLLTGENREERKRVVFLDSWLVSVV